MSNTLTTYEVTATRIVCGIEQLLMVATVPRNNQEDAIQALYDKFLELWRPNDKFVARKL